MKLFSAALFLCATALLSSCVSESYAIHSVQSFERPMNSDDPAAIREAEYVRARREATLVPMELPYVGHAMSGGGLRSAVLNLGALQGLNETKSGDKGELSVLDRIDFMSAVSGGGYTAAWYVSHLDPVTPEILAMRQGKIGSDISSRVHRDLVESYASNTVSAHARRKGIKVIGHDINGFKSSSSFNGDLLISNPMSNYDLEGERGFDSQEGVGFGYGIFHLRGNAHHLADENFGLMKPAWQWGWRYPLHLTFDMGLHWIPADKFNYHYPVNIYADGLGGIFTRSDVAHELSMRTEPEAQRSNPDTLRLREWPLPHHDSARIALEDCNTKYSEAPLLILNCRLINAEHQGDKTRAEAFEFTPLYSGSEAIGYVDTKALNMHISKREDGDSGARIYGSHRFHLFGFIPCGEREKLPLQDAIAASGAAADGSYLNPVADFFMRVFNINLRYRMVNYNQESWSNEYLSLGARFWNTIYETTVGRFWCCEQEESSTLALADGGHFENLGVYALVRRQIPLITCIDASYDPTGRCDDLQNLLHILRREGYSVSLRPKEAGGDQDLQTGLSLALSDRAGGPRLPLDRFIYTFDIEKPSVGYHGVLILGKLCFTPEAVSSLPTDVAAMLTRYKQAEPDFPFLKTFDLTFDAYQWEALRVLGRHIGLQLGKAAKKEMKSGN